MELCDVSQYFIMYRSACAWPFQDTVIVSCVLFVSVRPVILLSGPWIESSNSAGDRGTLSSRMIILMKNSPGMSFLSTPSLTTLSLCW